MNSISTQEVGDNVQTRQTGKNKKKHRDREKKKKIDIYACIHSISRNKQCYRSRTNGFEIDARWLCVAESNAE